MACSRAQPPSTCSWTGITTLTSEAMVYVLAVVLASYAVSRTAAVVGAVGAVLCLNFFFIEPRYTLQVDARENATALVAMLAVALVISHLAAVSQARDRVRPSQRAPGPAAAGAGH